MMKGHGAHGESTSPRDETGGGTNIMNDRSKEKVAKLLGRRTQSVCEAEKEIAEGKKIIQSVDKLSKFFGEATEAIPLTFSGKSGESGDSDAIDLGGNPFRYMGRLLDAGNFAAVNAALPNNAAVTQNYIFTTHLSSVQTAFGVACIIWEIAGIKEDLDLIISALLHSSVNTNSMELCTTVEERFGHNVLSTVVDTQRFINLSREAFAMAHVRQPPPAAQSARLLLMADLFYRVSYVIKHPPSVPLWTVYGMDRTLEALKGYFCWAESVFKTLDGTSEALSAAFLQVFAGRFSYKEWEGPVLVDQDLRDAYMEKYYIFLRFIDEIGPMQDEIENNRPNSARGI